MNPEIFNFSATGNSLSVAKDIAAGINASLIPVESTFDEKSIHTDTDMVGLVFPVYDFKPPGLILDFVRKIENLESKYIFAICTYGIAPLGTLKNLDSILKELGGKLSAGFPVEMPHNGIASGILTETQRDKMYKNWQERRAGIIEILNLRKEFVDNKKYLDFKLLRMFPSLIRFMWRVSTKGMDSLSLCANEECDSCGICEKVCPVHNVSLDDDKTPVWSDECAGCFGCLHWCPRHAVTLGGFNANIQAYHHPDIGLKDIIRRR